MALSTATKANPDQRSRDILDAARLAFSEKGFDGASMQDLARAAGMSVGNFYRYYPSKAAIVQALVLDDMEQIEQSFVQLSGSENPLTALRSELHSRILTGKHANEGTLWAEINAASLRNPEIAETCKQMEATVSQYLLILFAQLTGLTRAEARARFGGHAEFIMMLVRAAAMLRPQDPSFKDGMNVLFLKSIDNVLDDVVSARVKG